jgi:hypothetical protein
MVPADHVVRSMLIGRLDTVHPQMSRWHFAQCWYVYASFACSFILPP